MSFFVELLFPFEYFSSFLDEQCWEIFKVGLVSQFWIGFAEFSVALLEEGEKLIESNSWDELVSLSVKASIDPKIPFLFWLLKKAKCFVHLK